MYTPVLIAHDVNAFILPREGNEVTWEVFGLGDQLDMISPLTYKWKKSLELLCTHTDTNMVGCDRIALIFTCTITCTKVQWHGSKLVAHAYVHQGLKKIV